MNPQPVLEVVDLSYSYPGRHVFNAWSAAFGPGLSWVRGGNGSGKSTLLKLLAGALPPLAGSLRLQGIDAAARPLDYRREVCWCGPAAIAFDHLQPPEYFAFLGGLYPRFDAAAAARHVEGFGLAPFLGRRLRELSTGTQRKVWLTAALAAGTRVTLLDEPLNALDRASLAYLLARLGEAAAAAIADAPRAWIVASHEDLGAAGAQARALDLDARPTPAGM